MVENLLVPRVAIVDYGIGNLFSVRQACVAAGLDGVITSDWRVLQKSDAVILPGVGAFGDAMETLKREDMISALQDFAASGKPLVGICLGIQLLMTESHEFGSHKGLNIIPGEVVKFSFPCNGGRLVKIPHVGWNRIRAVARREWNGTLLEGTADGAYMYFVHSFYVVPESEEVVVATTTYEGQSICAALAYRNIFACQFHPERSGAQGLRIYRRLAESLRVS